MDISEPMLQRAATRFAGEQHVIFCSHDLRERLANTSHVAAGGPYNAIVSALAIHHLADKRKRSLLADAHALLEPGGVIANLDLVRPASSAQHDRFHEAIGRREGDPSDRLAPLCDQLAWLREAGFVEVDCHFKWLEMALMIGVKPR